MTYGWHVLYADLCWPMLTYADLCWPLLSYADLCWPMLTYADLCWRMDFRTRYCAARGSWASMAKILSWYLLRYLLLCVRILLYASYYVAAYYCEHAHVCWRMLRACWRMLTYADVSPTMWPHTTATMAKVLSWYIYYHMCPHTTIYVSYIRVRILLQGITEISMRMRDVCMRMRPASAYYCGA
jgi:hypothetical protein